MNERRVLYKLLDRMEMVRWANKHPAGWDDNSPLALGDLPLFHRVDVASVFA
jgi:hypothetical protein